MIDWWQAIILAIVQGLTEFLPISSSAHLVLPAEVLGWQDQGLAFDVAVHFGSLIAVMSYFWRDIIQLIAGWSQSLIAGQQNQQSQMAWAVIVATIPAGLIGFALDDFIEANLRSVAVIATTTIVFGLLLAVADRATTKADATVTFRNAVIIGFAQALALIPGTSRSGITMTAALLLGLSRQMAARFSFLLATPLILVATALKTWQLASGSDPVPWTMLITATAMSGITAFACIHWFLALIDRIGFMPFVIYRLLLGAVLIGLLVMGVVA